MRLSDEDIPLLGQVNADIVLIRVKYPRHPTQQTVGGWQSDSHS